MRKIILFFLIILISEVVQAQPYLLPETTEPGFQWPTEQYTPSHYHSSQLVQFLGIVGSDIGFTFLGIGERARSNAGWLDDSRNNVYHAANKAGLITFGFGSLSFGGGIISEERHIRDELKKMLPSNPRYTSWKKKTKPGRTALRIGGKIAIWGLSCWASGQLAYHWGH